MPLHWSGDQFKGPHVKPADFVFKATREFSNALYMTFINFVVPYSNSIYSVYNTAATDVEIVALWKVSDFILNLNKQCKAKYNNDQSKGHVLDFKNTVFCCIFVDIKCI